VIEVPSDEDVALVSVEDIGAYLTALGWRQRPGLAGISDLWLPPREAPRGRVWRAGLDDLVLPRDRGVLDYSRRVAEAIGILAFVEQRPATMVLRDILMARADVIRFKRPSASPEGSIPLADGLTLVDQALDMMTAAASSAVAARRVIPSRRPLLTQQYLQRVRLGQTEKSSYVITIISPLERLEGEEATLFHEMEETFPRRVTRTLTAGLEALAHATEQVRRDGDFRVFDEVVRVGVSANLCESVARLIRSPEREAAVHIQVDWAAVRPQPEVASQVSFEPDVEPYLNEAAKRFRAAEPLEGTILTGVVVRLQRGRDQLEGRITVSCVVDGALRQLSVPLGLADYQNAVDAHRERRGVMFRADVSREGRGYVATNVREFRVV
jgi:hypothetical protein